MNQALHSMYGASSAIAGAAAVAPEGAVKTADVVVGTSLAGEEPPAFATPRVVAAAAARALAAEKAAAAGVHGPTLLAGCALSTTHS